MISFIRDWIIQVLVTVIFLIIVDMVLPDNNFKKYAKFASGLIIIIVLLTPVIKLFNGKLNLEGEIEKYINTYSNIEANIDYEKVKNEKDRETLRIFKEKLAGNIEDLIYKKTGKGIEVVKIEIIEETSDYNFSEVKFLEIIEKKHSGRIKTVDRVVVGKGEIKEVNKDEHLDILQVLKDEFNVNPETIKFVK